jgi:uncharacterized membrane-anchored protein
MKQTSSNASHYCIIVTVILIFTIGLASASASRPPAEPPAADWIAGPTHVDLGKKLADLNLEDGYIFANAEDTVALLEYMGNIPNKKELGLITPNEEHKNWFIVFRHYPVGFVKDDEKDSIDSEAILNAIREGTEQANEIRAQKGITPLTIIGWYQEPYYDEVTHNLAWTILAEQDGEEIVNHNVRLLGRQGYISVVLVADAPTLDSSMAELNAIISNVTYKKGKSYAEYVKGDKVAKYGLTALIAGGSAAAAAKFGLFKFLGKAWKVIVIGALGILAGLKKTLKSAFGGKNQSATHLSSGLDVRGVAAEKLKDVNDLPG